MSDLLDLLADLDVVHGIQPNMWAACGWCLCGCAGNKGDKFTLRYKSTRVTCQPCLREVAA